MKKIFYVFVLAVVLISCKNAEEKNETATEEVEKSGPEARVTMPIFRGEFIFTDDAAVLKGNNFIYGVTIDDMSRKLAAQVEPVKKDEFDMVGVIVKGFLTKKAEGDEGWEDILTIIEIMRISEEPAPVDIKIEETK